jgi:hypothetical protein
MTLDAAVTALALVSSGVLIAGTTQGLVVLELDATGTHPRISARSRTRLGL